LKEKVFHMWKRFVSLLGAFLDELFFRVGLATYVLLGKMPRPIETRWWNRAIETPALLEVTDWVNGRKLFSVLIWPPLEVAPEEAQDAFYERVEAVKNTIANGAAAGGWSLMFSVDDSLHWDPDRGVWVAWDEFRYAPPSKGSIKEKARTL